MVKVNVEHVMNGWELNETASCECGNPRQTMSHLIENCSFHLYEKGLSEIDKLEGGAVKMLHDLKIYL